MSPPMVSSTTSTPSSVRGEVGGPVVDDLIGAQGRDEIMLGRARRAGYVSTASLGDLDLQVPDAAAGPMDQHPLARRHLGGVHQGLPRGKTHQWKRGGFGVGQAGGLAGKLTRRRRDILRVRPGARGKNGIPYTSSPGWNRVTPGSMSSITPLISQPRMNGGLPSSGNCPDRITASTGCHPHCPHPDQHLGGQRHRSLHLSEPQHLRTAEGLLPDRLHRCGHRYSSVPDRRRQPRYDARRPIGTDWYPSARDCWQRVPGRLPGPAGR